MDPLTLALGAGSLAAGFFSAKSASKGQEQANQMSAEESQKNRDFQLMMSSTAHQREVADLRAAGLNPILSANSGASSMPGSMAVFQSPTKDSANIMSNSAKGATDAAVNSALVSKTKADTLASLESVKTQKSQQVSNVSNAKAALINAQSNATTASASQLNSRGRLSLPSWLGGSWMPLGSVTDKVRSLFNFSPSSNRFASGSVNRAGQSTGR